MEIPKNIANRYLTEDQHLANRVALVAGGAGAVGEGVTRAFLAGGAHVVVPSRSGEKLAALAGCMGADLAARLMPIEDHVGTPEGAARILQQVQQRFGALDAVVASIGGWQQGAPLTQVTLDTWRQVLEDNLTAHFVAARTFLPALTGREGASYTFIAGFAGEQPQPGAGPVSTAAAGQLMMARVLMEEHAVDPVRISTLLLGPIITRARPEGQGGWLTADEVGALAALLADEQSGVEGETIRLPDRDALLRWMNG